MLPATEHLLALAALYQVSVDRLLNGRGEENGKKKGRGKWLPALLAALLCLVTAVGRANHAPMEAAVLCLLLAAGAALTWLALWLRKFLQKNWTMP